MLDELKLAGQKIMAEMLRAKDWAAKSGAEEVSKKIPAPVMPREAVEKKRQQLRDLDAQTKD